MDFRLALLFLIAENHEDVLAQRILRAMNSAEAIEVLEDHAASAIKFAAKLRKSIKEEKKLPSNVIPLRPS